MKIPKGMILFIGAPGSGKTTLAAYFARKFMKKYPEKNCFSNVPILGTKRLDVVNDLGVYLVEDGMILIDEGGIVFNNRAYKSLPKSTISFAKLYRHYNIRHFFFFSQGMDIDVTFVRLCDRIVIVRKSIIPFFVYLREVKKTVGIDDLTHQLVDCYAFKPHGRHWVFMPPVWKMFDTYDTPELPSKEYPKWNNKLINATDASCLQVASPASGSAAAPK